LTTRVCVLARIIAAARNTTYAVRCDAGADIALLVCWFLCDMRTLTTFAFGAGRAVAAVTRTRQHLTNVDYDARTCALLRLLPRLIFACYPLRSAGFARAPARLLPPWCLLIDRLSTLLTRYCSPAEHIYGSPAIHSFAHSNLVRLTITACLVYHGIQRYRPVNTADGRY